MRLSLGLSLWLGLDFITSLRLRCESYRFPDGLRYKERYWLIHQLYFLRICSERLAVQSSYAQTIHSHMLAEWVQFPMSVLRVLYSAIDKELESSLCYECFVLGIYYWICIAILKRVSTGAEKSATPTSFSEIWSQDLLYQITSNLRRYWFNRRLLGDVLTWMLNKHMNNGHMALHTFGTLAVSVLLSFFQSSPSDLHREAA